MPNGGLEALLKAERGELDPLSITASQYDLVCNGVELSSGAVRNHDPEIMVKAFELVRLGEDDVKAKFPAMYNAFCYGAPPHAGIAPGVDRMVMLLAGEDSIREIIPFPMNKNAQDVMMDAPSAVDAAAARRAAHRHHREGRISSESVSIAPGAFQTECPGGSPFFVPLRPCGLCAKMGAIPPQSEAEP